MVNQEEVKQLIKNYFSEANDEQIEKILEELIREIEVFTHAKIRELVNQQRIKKAIANS